MGVSQPVSQQKAHFTSAFDSREQILTVRFDAMFRIEDWSEVEKLSQKELADGHIRWKLDLRELKILSSRMMGLIIGLNAILDIRGGALELIVNHDSGVAWTLKQARIGRITTITEV